MISFPNKSFCVGCQACEQKCPKHCITMAADEEGFLYPKIDKEKCVNCGLCNKTCPVSNKFNTRKALQAFAAYNDNLQIRIKSSSGGVFSLLSEAVLNKGGYVFGAQFDDKWQVVISKISSISDIARLRGSKYIQSRTETSYQECEDLLKKNHLVLYSGTPCQIAGLNHFLGKSYDNLVTCDVVCHGSPSPEVWKRYLQELVTDVEMIDSISFRCKETGWKDYSFVVNKNDHSRIIEKHNDNLFMKAFLSELILRPSCYNCPAKEGRSFSDITLADYWGVGDYHAKMDDDLGTSLVLINTENGKKIFDSLTLKKEVTSFDNAFKFSAGLKSTIKSHPKRENFFSKLKTTKSVHSLIKKCTREPLIKSIRHKIGDLKRKILHYCRNQ